MKGLQILMHSIRQVIGNLDGAIKVSLVPYGIQALAGTLLLGGAMGMARSGGPGAGMAGLGFGWFVFVLVLLVTSLWIAVGWHRYILLNERPTGFVPVFDAERIFAYFLRSLGYGILLILIAMVLGLVVGGLLSPLVTNGRVGLFMILSALLIQLPLVLLSFRFTAGLPGAALGQGTDFMAGWQATSGATMDIAVLSVIVVVANLALTLIDVYVFGGLWILSLIWGLLVGWLVTMVGISILTTLYGHYVEKRPLV
jgi:hypothetical protein